MLSIQAVRGLPCLCAPGIVPCIISFSRQNVSSWCDHSTLASLLWQCLTVLSLLSFVKNPLICFLCYPRNQQSFSALSSQRRQDVFLHCFWVSSFYSGTLLQAILTLSSVVSSLKSVCCDFSIFSAVMPRSPAPCLTWYGIPEY